MTSLSLHESKHFVWSTLESDELGRGKFGKVFRGIDKATGEAVAVKVFGSGVLPEREVEVLQGTNHVNIVKLLGYEANESGRQRRDSPSKVIIMELCDGGSLLKMLEHPKNAFGLEEDEFLIVLRDITSGMKYLRENGIIHRDIKPANIMKCIADDRSSIYKITDFGAARELQEHEEYSSIVGTQEYLDPDVYEQALFKDSTMPKKKFSPSTDLWSIGATLYHVATGMLPFRPLGERKNPKVMHLMTTKKESGVISAYQIKDDETIVFERHLPQHCLLSPCLRKLICPLLAGLMEVDPRKKLTFEAYFERVYEISNRTQFHIFNINESQLLRLYINPNETKTFEDLNVVIRSFTKIQPENQILLFKGSTLEEILDNVSEDVCLKLPNTTRNGPVILCDRANAEVGSVPCPTPFGKKLFHNRVDFKMDACITHHNCKVAYNIKRQIDEECRKANLIYSAIETINHVVVTQLTSASKENSLIHKCIHAMKNQFEMMKSFSALCNIFLTFVPEDIENGSTLLESIKKTEAIYSSQYCEFQKLVEMLCLLQPSVDSLFGSRVRNRFLINNWKESSGCVKGVPDFFQIGKIAETRVYNVCKEYKKIHEFLNSVSRKGGVTESENFLHLIERNRMMQEMDKLEKHQTDCSLNFSTLNSAFSEWYKLAIAVYIQPEILIKDIMRLQEKILESEKCLNEAVRNFKLQLEDVTESFSSLPVVVGNLQDVYNRKESARALQIRLQELSRAQDELQLSVKVNIELGDQLQGLLMSSLSDEPSP